MCDNHCVKRLGSGGPVRDSYTCMGSVTANLSLKRIFACYAVNMSRVKEINGTLLRLYEDCNKNILTGSEFDNLNVSCHYTRMIWL